MTIEINKIIINKFVLKFFPNEYKNNWIGKLYPNRSNNQ